MTRPVEELIIFSDLHAHNFKYGSRRVGLYNSRLLDAVNVLNEIYEYARYNTPYIDTLLYGGDLFHRRSILNVDAYNLISQKLVEISKNHDLLLIPGNHDYADRQGKIHSLQALDFQIGMLDTVYSYVTQANVAVITVPFTDDLETARKWLKEAGEIADAYTSMPRILLAHLGMQGAKVGSDYILVSDQDVKVSDVPHQKFTACFFGHYHEHQQLFANGWYIGATHEHNWGDSGGKRGFLHVRVFDDHVEFDRIETQAPKFVTIDGETVPTRDKDFVRVYMEGTLSQSVAKRLDSQIPNASLEVIPKVDKSPIVLTLEASQLEPEAALRAWVEQNPPEQDVEDYLSEGLTLLRTTYGEEL
jgi:DNA repair exonuclease SbcCD nuclease subunit